MKTYLILYKINRTLALILLGASVGEIVVGKWDRFYLFAFLSLSCWFFAKLTYSLLEAIKKDIGLRLSSVLIVPDLNSPYKNDGTLLIICKDLKCSYDCAKDVWILRNSGKWSQDRENELVNLHALDLAPDMAHFV